MRLSDGYNMVHATVTEGDSDVLAFAPSRDSVSSLVSVTTTDVTDIVLVVIFIFCNSFPDEMLCTLKG